MGRSKNIISAFLEKNTRKNIIWKALTMTLGKDYMCVTATYNLNWRYKSSRNHRLIWSFLRSNFLEDCVEEFFFILIRSSLSDSTFLCNHLTFLYLTFLHSSSFSGLALFQVGTYAIRPFRPFPGNEITLKYDSSLSAKCLTCKW